MQGSSGPVVRLCCLQIDDHSRLVDLLVEPDVLASWSRPFWNCDAASAIAERSCWKPGSHQTRCGSDMVSNSRSLVCEIGEIRGEPGPFSFTDDGSSVLPFASRQLTYMSAAARSRQSQPRAGGRIRSSSGPHPPGR